MPVAVRNMKTGPATFSIPEERVEIHWAGKGDPSGGDIQEVPEDLMKNVNLRRAFNNGIFEVVDAEAAQAAAEAQVSAARSAADSEVLAARESIDPAANNDITASRCQGPNSRGNGECGVDVPVRESDRGERPILCAQHSHLAPEFIPVETEEMHEVNGRLVPVQRWVRPSLGDRETGR